MKLKYNSPVILTFALISFVALILNMITNGASNKLLFSVYRFQMTDPLGYLRLFSHVLGHVNFEHFSSNMLLFLLTGPLLEEKYGSKNILIIILITAFITGVIHITFSQNGLLGASGVVFTFITLASITSVKSKEIPITMIIISILYIGNEALSLSTNDNISHLTHILGGLVGMGIGLLITHYKGINNTYY